jgi:membrane fusion protein, multidrug efflux system
VRTWAYIATIRRQQNSPAPFGVASPRGVVKRARGAMRSCALMACGFAMIASVAALGCRGSKDTGFEGGQAVPVLVAKAVEKTVASKVNAIGKVEAYSTVDVKSQIDGVVTEVHFREGQDVKKGDLLFTIDPRPFEAMLHQAQANLARDAAQRKQAAADEQRYSYLLKQGVGSRQQYDQALATSDALKASVAADAATVQSAQLSLAYTSIRSPIDGRTGGLIVHAGNLVKANADTFMVVINQIQPVYVDFSLPEQSLAEVRRYMAERKLAVEVAIPGEQGDAEHGELSFVDNSVDAKTGTIELKGLFANETERLWPGQFVDATLVLDERPNTILIPSQAVQTGQEGSYVYVVDSGMKVETRPIVIGDAIDGETVIERGLKAGETVVTDGQLRLLPGSKVTIKSGLSAPGVPS